MLTYTRRGVINLRARFLKFTPNNALYSVNQFLIGNRSVYVSSAERVIEHEYASYFQLMI